ncbi:MAG: hypothetical protein ACOCP1_02790 [Campylobacterales bacterium]
MPKKTISPLKWELIEGQYVDETGMVSSYVIIYFETLSSHVEKLEFNLKAKSEHFLLLDDFFIKKEKTQKEGGGEQVHTHYELLELLEKCSNGK